MNPRSAERLVRAARAAQVLSETLWEALHEELTDPSERRVAELSVRLADVSAAVALLARSAADQPVVQADASVSAPPRSRAATPIQDERAESGEPLASPQVTSARGVSIHDEAAPPRPREPELREPSPRDPASPAVLVDELAAAVPVREFPAAAPEPGERAVQEIEIRDERHEDARSGQAAGVDEPGPWIGAIERRLERHERDHAPFAVLVVELVDVERLRHTELPGEMSRLMGLVENALSGELRPADSLTRESPGRYWLLAPETDSSAARARVERLASAVRDAAGHGGAPLEVAVGIAACPADGAQAAVLAAHAEVSLYAARASGKPVV